MAPSSGMEQIGPICVSALSSGVRIQKLKFLILRSFFLFGHAFLLDVLASVIGLGKREFEALSCAIFVVLKQPGGWRCNSEDDIILIE